MKRNLRFRYSLAFLIACSSLIFGFYFFYNDQWAAPYEDTNKFILDMFSEAKLSKRSRYQIPKILHQSWKNETLPTNYARYRRSWLEMHPSWVQHLWTDVENRELVRLCYPWFLPYYDNFPLGVMRADAMRYLYMHRFGGMYADLDMEPLRRLDFLIDDATTPITLAYLGKSSFYRRHGVPAAFLISEPGHIFWMLVIRSIIRIVDWDKGIANQSPELVTGPVMFYRTLMAYSTAHPDTMMAGFDEESWSYGSLKHYSSQVGDISILPPGVIYPYDWRQALESSIIDQTAADVCWGRSNNFNETACKSLYPNAYTITYHFMSWGDDWYAYTANKTTAKKQRKFRTKKTQKKRTL